MERSRGFENPLARTEEASGKVCTGQENNTPGAKALMGDVGYGPAKAVP
jgi:hypothetical protein